MPESFEKYRLAERGETNATLDDPVVFLADLTKFELLIGVITFLVCIYFMMINWLVTLLSMPAAPLVVWAMKYIRTKLPANFFMQLIWSLGMQQKALERHIKRPEKSYFSR